MANDPRLGYGLAGCGGFLGLAALALGCFGAFHVLLDPRGKISADEALPALAGGFCLALPALLLVGGGIFLAVRARKAAQTPDS